jgi:DHA1 family multidrug resistance protein-like MFS transporter
MKELIRESALGQIIRLVSGTRLLRYPEEEPDFQIPFERMTHEKKLSEINKEIDVQSEAPSSGVEEHEAMEKVETAQDRNQNFDIEKRETNLSRAGLEKLSSVKSISRTQTIPFTRERFEADQILAAQRTLSLPIEPVITSTGQILVTWYTTDDQDNPQNWSQKKKSYVSFLIWLVLRMHAFIVQGCYSCAA